MKRTFEKAKILRAVDGDTFDVDVDLGFFVFMKIRIRIRGIDTEEMKDKDPLRAAMANRQKLFAVQFEGKECGLRVHRQDLHGRWESDLFIGGVDYEMMLFRNFGIVKKSNN